MDSIPTDSSETPEGREDWEGQLKSTEQQFNAIAYLLGVSRTEVADADARANESLKRIVDHMVNVRGRIAERAALYNVLRETYAQQLGVAEARLQTQEATLSDPERRGYAVAEALLHTVDTHLKKEEIRAFLQEAPTAIRPVDGKWKVNVSLGGIGTDIEIDLTHQDWKSGDQETIRKKLIGRRPSEVGIATTPPYNAPLKPEDVAEIFKSECDIISQRMPQWDLELSDFPAAGQRTMVDVARMLREAPQVANMNQATLEGELGGTLSTLYYNCVRAFDENSNRITPQPAPPAILPGLFAHLHRTGRTFAQESSSLTDAIERRAAVENLVKSDATNRELLLALAAIRRDPTAADVIEFTSEGENIAKELEAENSLLQAARAVESIGGADEPNYSPNEIKRGEKIMNTVIQNAATYEGYSSATDQLLPVDLFTGLTGPDLAAAQKTGIRQNINFEYKTKLGTSPASSNIDVFRKIAEKAQEKLQEFTAESQKIDAIEVFLNDLGATLRERGIQPGALLAADYPKLRQYLKFTGTPPFFGARRSQIGSKLRTDKVPLIEEFKKALKDAPPDPDRQVKSLRSVVHYEQEVQDISGRLDEAESRTPETFEGSEACWNVIRQGLENQGLRKEEVESTIKYMRAHAEMTPDFRRELDGYAQRDIEPHDPEAVEEWNRSHGFRQILLLGVRGTKPLQQYMNNLFTRENVGLTIQEGQNPGSHPLPRIIDAYHRTKYLVERIGEPYRLPYSQEITQFLRNLHREILERSHKSGLKGMGLKEEDRATVEEAGASDDMTPWKRLQAIRSNLVEGGAEYAQKQGEKIDRMARLAYRPIERAQQRHDKGVTALKVATSPAWVPFYGAYKGGKYAKDNPKKVAVNGGLAAVGIGVAVVTGFAALPGLVLFGAGAPILYNMFKKRGAAAT